MMGTSPMRRAKTVSSNKESLEATHTGRAQDAMPIRMTSCGLRRGGSHKNHHDPRSLSRVTPEVNGGCPLGSSTA
jgi:hypothetical protein